MYNQTNYETVVKSNLSLFQIDSKKIKTFSDLPLSEETKKGLAECEYEVPTEIQKETLTLGLRGLDILGKMESFDIFTYFCKVAMCYSM